MLQPVPRSSEHARYAPRPYEFVSNFDTLVDNGHTELAASYISGYTTQLAGNMERGGYNPAFYKAAIRDLAMPMYKKVRADHDGAQYYEQRAEISALYDGARELLGVLTSFSDGRQYYNDVAVGEASYSSELRGDQSELIFFALMTRSMTGFADDYSVLPSFGVDDIGMIAKGGVRTGYDFTVYQRESDTVIPVQIKTAETDKAYAPDITVVSIKSLAQSADVSVRELSGAIMADIVRNDDRVQAVEQALMRALPASGLKYA